MASVSARSRAFVPTDPPGLDPSQPSLSSAETPPLLPKRIDPSSPPPRASPGFVIIRIVRNAIVLLVLVGVVVSPPLLLSWSYQRASTNSPNTPLGFSYPLWRSIFASSSVVGVPVLLAAYARSHHKIRMLLMAPAWCLFSSLYGLILGVNFASPSDLWPQLSIGSCLSAWLRPSSALIYPLHALQLATFVQFVMLSRSRLRGVAFRRLISYPASIHITALVLLALLLPFMANWPTFVGGKVNLLVTFGAYLLALVSFPMNIRVSKPEDWIHMVIDMTKGSLSSQDVTVRRLGWFRQSAQPSQDENTLSVVQITDPHIGPLMSVERLHSICLNAVRQKPDLVILTGDFLTVEAESDPSAIKAALSPLTPMGESGRVFACLGNHDHETPETLQMIKDVLRDSKIQLLVDAKAIVNTRVGPVQVTGFDFYSPLKKLDQRIRQLCATVSVHPDIAIEILMLHDPAGFRHIPPDRGCVVFSGHTHGGQLGLLSLGFSWTITQVMGVLDHGLFSCGQNLLYVNRAVGARTLLGTFLLRVGVPPEESVMHIRCRK